MKHKRFLLILPAFIFLVCSAVAAKPISVTGGRITGTTDKCNPGIYVFRGIPFAAPPLGKLRWRPPQPVKPWDKPRQCTEYGPACPQPEGLASMGHYKNQSEDCLYLNVWTPSLDPQRNLPVMVWIHGGGFTIGSGSQRHYDGAGLARKDVVVVTINYRLGPFGFLAHPELSKESPKNVSGNYGLLDQIAALKWVKTNISKFGGNPNNVTIFGESAGSVSCACLLVSPLAKGLFQRAILESGTAIGIRQPIRAGEDAAEEQGIEFQKVLKTKNISDLREKDARDLLAAEKVKVGLLGKGHKYGPIVDGYVIPDKPAVLLATGKFNRVPVIIGTNEDEGTLFGQQIMLNSRFLYKFLIRRLYGEDAKKILAHFDFDNADNPKKLFLKMLTLSAFVNPAKMTADSIAQHQPAIYYYHFTRVPALSRQLGLGATHGLEIAYVFGTGKMVLVETVDRDLSDTIQKYWINFARTGNPNSDNMPKWPVFTTGTDYYLELGDTVTARKALYPEECKLFREITEKKLTLTPGIQQKK